MMKLVAVTLLVRDYDEAITWFRDKLNFELIEDTKLSAEKRWVRLAPPNASTSLLLARADTEEQRSAIGKAAGGRVGFFLHSDDFHADYEAMRSAKVKFREEPRHEAYGTVAVFEDLYGNAWDLVGPRTLNL
jgi:catechol 2,3-dioxygenase-like lactoylglutathione lyase family enzyme